MIRNSIRLDWFKSFGGRAMPSQAIFILRIMDEIFYALKMLWIQKNN